MRSDWHLFTLTGQPVRKHSTSTSKWRRSLDIHLQEVTIRGHRLTSGQCLTSCEHRRTPRSFSGVLSETQPRQWRVMSAGSMTSYYDAYHKQTDCRFRTHLLSKPVIYRTPVKCESGRGYRKQLVGLQTDDRSPNSPDRCTDSTTIFGLILLTGFRCFSFLSYYECFFCFNLMSCVRLSCRHLSALECTLNPST